MPNMFGTFDYGSAPYYILYDGSDTLLSPAPIRHQVTAYASRAGGVLTEMPPAMRVVPIGGAVRASYADGSLETALDVLKLAFSRPRQLLTTGTLAGRAIIATCTALEITIAGPGHATYTAEFTAEDAYLYALAPSAHVGLPTFTVIPGSTTTRRATLTLTPGGTAPAPLRYVSVQQAGAQSVTQTVIRNTAYGPQYGVAFTTAQPAGYVLLLTGETQLDSNPHWSTYLYNASGCVGWWPFEDVSGTPFDFSGNSRDLTVTGTPLYRRGGVVGSAIELNGAASLSTTNAAFQLGGAAGAFTVGAWVQPSTLGTLRGITGKAAALQGYAIHQTAANVFEAQVGNGTTPRIATGATVIQPGRWYFVALTFTQSTGVLSLYVDGVLDAQTAGGAYTITHAVNALSIGATYNPTGGALTYFQGLIDEPFVLSSALTQADLLKVMYDSLPSLGTKYAPYGVVPSLNPQAGTTNVVTIDEISTTAPTTRVALSWRSRWG